MNALLSSPIRTALLAATVCGNALPFARASAGASVPAPAAPSFTEHPANQTLNQGETLTLSAAAVGYTSPGLQWRKDGQNLAGATAARLTIPNAQPADSGNYEVVASNKVGHATSSSARVLVVATNLPLVLRAPASQTVSLGGTARFELLAAASTFPSYQWRKDGVFLAGATKPVLVITNVQASDEGAYDVLLSNTRSGILSAAATLSMVGSDRTATPAGSAPAGSATPTTPGTAAARGITSSVATPVAPGTPVTFTAAAPGEELTFQWHCNGRPIPGATHRALTLPAVTAADMGFYSVVIRDSAGTTESEPSVLIVAASGESRLVNLSTRGLVPAGGSLTAGFTWRGPSPKPLLLRAVGPSLARFGVEGALPHPTLELFPAGASAPLARNDDWRLAATSSFLAATAAAGAFALDPGASDAALLTTQPATAPAHATIRITSADTAAGGVVLAEIYDPEAPTSASRLTGVSVLGFAGPGSAALLPGFTIAGTAPKRVLLRAIGPGLAALGVEETLSDPRLAVHAHGMAAPIAHNDNWSDSVELAAAHAAVGAFALAPNSRDAALVLTLPPGGYTLALTSGHGTPGFALIEIYDLDP